MTSKIRKMTMALAAMMGMTIASSAHAGPVIGLEIVPPRLTVAVAPPPPPVRVVHVAPTRRVWVPSTYRIDRRGRRVLVPGHYEVRRVTKKRVVVVR